MIYINSHISPYRKACDDYFIPSSNHEMYLQQVKNLLYLHLMINNVMKTKLKANHGIDSTN